MNWFEILKEVKTVQSQRQGMKPIDIQKPFKRVKEEEDCRQKVINEYTRICQKLYGKAPEKMSYSNENIDYYRILSSGQPSYYESSFLKISYPKNSEANKAFCSFAKELAKGRSLFPQVERFSKTKWKYLDNTHTIWTQTRTNTAEQARGQDEKINYSATLYSSEDDMWATAEEEYQDGSHGPAGLGTAIDLQFAGVKAGDW